MKNAEFWKNQTAVLDSSKLSIPVPEEILGKVMFAREMFDSAIMLIVAGEGERGKDCLEKSYEIFQQQNLPWIFRDFIRAYILYWLRNRDDEGIYLLEKAVSQLEREIYWNTIKFGFDDIYGVVRNIGLFYFDTRIDDIRERFKPESSDKLPYESVADHLLELGRLKLLIGNNTEAVSVIEAGMELYETALRKVDEEIGRECPHLRKFIDSGEDDRECEGSRDAGMFQQIRRIVRGDIPIHRYQAEVLASLAKLTPGEGGISDHPSFYLLQQFYDDFVNFEGKRESFLGLVAEVEWTILRDRYTRFFLPGGDTVPRETILNKLLG